LNDTKPPATGAGGDDDIPDIDDLEDESLALDGATLPPPRAAHGGIVRARRYDVSISYDKYYQTPRIWLFGHDEDGSPLTPEKMFDDVISDYTNKTVTLDPHPHISLPHASIHPCQHGVAMKRVVEELIAGGGGVPSSDQYLFIFLKFMQSVIPTVEFDNTITVQMKRSSPGEAAAVETKK
jgi:ubiquitin-like-conjugating enzyme ATG3